MTTIFDDTDQLAVTTIRTLSMDAVEKANSGHPGAPMGLAPIAYVLFSKHLKHDPADPGWPDRDRFVLSCGHASMLLYAVLHLMGYDLALDQIKSFRLDATCTPSATDIVRTADLDPDIWSISSFGEDAQGEHYVLGYHVFGGYYGVWKILPTLSIMELSALNAPPLRADANGDWIWEDLAVSSGNAIANYKVYRAGLATGMFFCVHQGPNPVWAGGDPVDPTVGNAYYYVVTALDGSEESRAGQHSDGTPRNVNFASACPP